MVSAFGVMKGVVIVALSVSAALFILIFPAFLLKLIDLGVGTNLYDLYLPILSLAISLSSAAFIPLAVVVDFIVNLVIELLNWILGWFGGELTYRLNLTAQIDRYSQELIRGITIIGAGATTSFFVAVGGNRKDIS